MHEYDTTLKILLQQSVFFLRDLTVIPVAEWLNVELPGVDNRRVDLLLRTIDDELLQIEFQSSNDAWMALRMAEYSMAIYRRSFSYELIDMREVSGERRLENPALGDIIFAVLGKLANATNGIRRILSRIRALPVEQRSGAYQCALFLEGWRNLEDKLEREEENMPITEDIWNNKVIGRERRLGELNILRRMIAKRNHIELEDLGERLIDATSLTELFG